MSILDISKIFMYDFGTIILDQSMETAKLCYTDIDNEDDRRFF